MIEDINPRAMAQASAARAGSAAQAIRPAQPGSLHNMSDGDLADEHRGQSFALDRAKTRLKAIEAELARRGLEQARGKTSVTTRHANDGLIDLKRLRAEMGDVFCRRFALPGSETYWRSRTLSADERTCR